MTVGAFKTKLFFNKLAGVSQAQAPRGEERGETGPAPAAHPDGGKT
jgi:hypothetical protein